MKKMTVSLIIISLLNFAQNASGQTSTDEFAVPKLPQTEQPLTMQQIDDYFAQLVHLHPNDSAVFAKAIEQHSSKFWTNINGDPVTQLSPTQTKPATSQNVKNKVQDTIATLRGRPTSEKWRNRDNPKTPMIYGYDTNAVRSTLGPKVASFAAGNLGFMVGMASVMLVSAVLQGDAAGIEAAKDAIMPFSLSSNNYFLNENFDGGGMVNLAVFGLTSQALTNYLQPSAEVTRFKYIGSNSITNWSMVAGSLVSSWFGQVWNTPARGLAYKNFKEWMRTFVSEKEYGEWTDGAMEAKDLREKISLLEGNVRLARPDQKKVINDQLLENQAKLKNIEPKIVTLRKKFWENVVTMGEVATQPFLPSKGLSDTIESSLRLVLVVQSLKYLGKAGVKTASLANEGLTSFLIKYAQKVPLRFIPVKPLIIGHTIQKGVFYNAFGKVVSALPFHEITMQLAMSAVHAVPFVVLDQMLKPVFTDVWESVKLNWNMVDEGFTQASFDFLKTNDLPSQSEKYEKVSAELDKYFEKFQDFENKVILGKFNELRGNWSKKIEKIDADWSKKLQYIQWLARSYQKTEKRGSDYLDYQDSAFVLNGGRLPWHEDPLYSKDFQTELDGYIVMFDTVLKEYQKQLDAFYKFKDDKNVGPQQPVDIVQVADYWLLGEQAEYKANLRRETQGMMRALKDVLGKSMFTAKAPFYKIEFADRSDLAKIFNENARYNLRSSLIRQYQLLREKYLHLNLPYSQISRPLMAGLLRNPEPFPPQVSDGVFIGKYASKNSIDDHISQQSSEGIMDVLREVGSLKPMVSFEQQERPYTQSERSDIISLEFAKRFAQIAVSFRNLPLQYTRLLQPTEPILTKGKLMNPFADDEGSEDLSKSIVPQESGYNEAHDIRNLAEYIRTKKAIEDIDLDALMDQLDKAKEKPAVEVKKHKKR